MIKSVLYIFLEKKKFCIILAAQYSQSIEVHSLYEVVYILVLDSLIWHIFNSSILVLEIDTLMKVSDILVSFYKPNVFDFTLAHTES